MFQPHYVIQFRKFSYQNWSTFPAKYATIEAALEHAEKLGYDVYGDYYRIAEAYMVVRYKALK